MREASDCRTATDTDSYAFFMHNANEGSPAAYIYVMKQYYAVKVDNVQNIVGNYNDYAFFHSGEYEKIIGHKQNQSKNSDVAGYVKLTVAQRAIYLKYHSSNAKADEIKLSYANLCRLGIAQSLPGGNERIVTVSKSNWFKYYWFHGDSGIRMPFRWAFLGFVFLLLNDVPSTIKSIYDLIHNILH